MTTAGISQCLDQAEAALERGDLERAQTLVLLVLQRQPDHVDACVVAGRVAQRRGDAQAALAHANRALQCDPDSPGAAMLRIELLLHAGQTGEARQELDVLAQRAGPHARLAHDIGQLYMHLDAPQQAERFYARACDAEPDNSAYCYNHSTALIALGRMDAAEQALDRVIALKGDDGDAWYNRATLRRQTPERNHVTAIEAQIERCRNDPQALVSLYHALAKELEDLGRHADSFAALQQGASLRRKSLSYRVEDDVGTMRALADAFDAEYLAREHAGCDDRRPLFVLGLPRSGTTLVDRILSSHSRIASRGESSSLALNLMRLAGATGGKAELIRRSLALDPAALGAAFCAELPALDAERIIDKTPANFLYLGLIAKALPEARIIHLRRNPMDGCYAMYKTLFRMAYPFSYDLDDLGRYWLAYDQLMRHWRALLPEGRMLEVDYENLVREPEAVTRRMLAHVGLPFEEACLAFERNPAPSMTASAAQVRQPIYTSSVGLWRNYRDQLEPLAQRLREAQGQHDTV